MLLRQLTEDDEFALVRLLQALKENGDDATFHPHQLDGDAARLACQAKRDFYAGTFCRREMVAYGMLRGWGEFEVPSLGVAVAPHWRGKRLGTTMTAYLGSVAAWLGATQVRLRVHHGNAIAIRIYESQGYVFRNETSDGQLVGVLDLYRRTLSKKDSTALGS